MPSFDYQEYLASREWALLKNMVRQRSGGVCERCHQANHQSTHHLTYARIGHELLEDLLGVCNPCHEWLSGKRNDDPALIVAPAPEPIRPKPILNRKGQQAKVYLAGKIGKNDWRHDIFPGLRQVISNNDLYEWQRRPSRYFNHQAPIIDPDYVDIIDLEADGFLYGGPYFVGCDHGGFHGEATHGQGAGVDETCCAMPGLSREQVAASCLELIRQSDFVFCWLDSPDAYGTVFELGYADALDKPIFLALSQNVRNQEMWFLHERASRQMEYDTGGGLLEAPTHELAWNRFVSIVVTISTLSGV